jgi:hypothetical protein
MSSTREDSASSRRESTSEVEEEEWPRAELARIVERKERVRELHRLKEEEEERLAKEEEELPQRMQDIRLVPSGASMDGFKKFSRRFRFSLSIVLKT